LFKPGTDGKTNEDYVSYGAPLLAVADSTVVKAVDGVPDTAPGAAPGGEDGLDINDVGGNAVVLQLAPNLFAFYLHNELGSTSVKVGDKVTTGQQIARLGSSGNSLSPHLHFQLGRSPQMLAAENIPYEFEAFVLQGTFTDTAIKAEPTPGPRQDEFPLDQNLIDFPESP
jgi:murein DD-endopeptidase MepM/ murein hydrolase activator NlpD